MSLNKRINQINKLKKKKRLQKTSKLSKAMEYSGASFQSALKNTFGNFPK